MKVGSFLKLPTLKYRQILGDMIQVHKIMHGRPIYDPLNILWTSVIIIND